MNEPVNDACIESNTVPTDENRARFVGDRLRQVFDEIVAEPLPEAFADLLRQLD